MISNTNPVFSTIPVETTHFDEVDAASYKGITIKTSILLLVTIAVAVLSVYLLPTMLNNNPTGLYVALGVSSFVGIFTVMFGRMSSKAAKYCSFIYSAMQGFALGVISAICELFVPGIASVAIFSTLIIFGVMLVLYATGVLRQGTFFRKLAFGLSFGAIALLIFIPLMSLFVPTLFDNLGLLIGLEAFFLIYGAITLIFNFDEASIVVNSGCTKDAEWSVSLGLIISIFYIYVEVLRLLLLVLANNDN